MQNMLTKEINTTNLPDTEGRFGEFGGSYIPPQLQTVMDEITHAYEEIVQDPAFLQELSYLQRHYVGRPSPVYHAKRLSKEVGGAQIYLKREDLNHTGAHKINHCIGEVLLAKKLGKKRRSSLKQVLDNMGLPLQLLLPYLDLSVISTWERLTSRKKLPM